MYFQFLDLPSVSHVMVIANRFFRVSSRSASVIHSMYSRLWLGLKSAKFAGAFLFCLERLRGRVE